VGQKTTKTIKHLLYILLITTICCHNLAAQTAMATDSSATNVNEKLLNKLTKQYQTTENNLVKQSTKWLNKIEKQELKLKAQLAKTDSAKAQQIFGNVQLRYKKLQQQLHNTQGKAQVYVPMLDSMHTATQFLKQNNIGNINQQTIATVNSTVASVQLKLQNATNIKQQLQQHKQQLLQQLANTALGSKMQLLQHNIHYYQQQLQQYKTLLNNPQQLVAQALQLVAKLPAFSSFFSKFSQYANLVGLPNATNSSNPANSNGLQTKALVQQSLSNQLATTTPNNQAANPTALISNKIEAANQQLAQAKNNPMHKLGEINNLKTIATKTNKNWQPNTQKTKTFWQRLQTSYNTQTQKQNGWLPTNTDFAANIGYKLNDKSTLGIGSSYKMGWGNGGLGNIKLSSQGMGLKAFINFKSPTTKGILGFLTQSIWLSVHYEYNYYNTLPNKNSTPTTLPLPSDIAHQQPTHWQNSFLIGIIKKQKLGNKTATLQLLYNLSNSSINFQAPWVVRVGWER
jgi:hypothetical protein